MTNSDSTKIKWRRLQEIVVLLIHREVELHGSTSLSDGIIAAASFNKDRADIAINFHRVKSLCSVMEALAHEALHIITNNTAHPLDFHLRVKRLVGKIKREYYKNE